MSLANNSFYRQVQQIVCRFGQRYAMDRFDWAWLIAAPLLGVLLLGLNHVQMQVLDILQFVVFTIILIWSGLRWRALRYCYLAVLVLVSLAMLFYLRGFERVADSFMLPYFLSSPAAVRWMVGLTGLAWLSAVLAPRLVHIPVPFLSEYLSWAALSMGLLAFFGRWHEGYLVGTEAALIPLANLYDVLVLLILFILLLHLVMTKLYRDEGWHPLTQLLALVMGCGLLYLAGRYQLNAIETRPAELSHWLLRLHVPAMALAYALLFMAGVLSLFYLVRYYRRMPASVDIGAIDRDSLSPLLLYRLVTTGFMLFSFAIVTGIIWSDLAWGMAWFWEVKQMTSFAVWCYYAAGLHALLRRHDCRMITAWWLVFGILLLLFALFWSNMLTPGHHYFGQLSG